MAIIWNDERLTPERMIQLLEDQRKHWLATAESFERLKTYLTGTFSLKDAEGSAQSCRMRAAALERTIKNLREQYEMPPMAPPADPPLLLIQ
jgi:hypothetical protein